MCVWVEGNGACWSWKITQRKSHNFYYILSIKIRITQYAIQHGAIPIYHAISHLMLMLPPLFNIQHLYYAIPCTYHAILYNSCNTIHYEKVSPGFANTAIRHIYKKNQISTLISWNIWFMYNLDQFLSWSQFVDLVIGPFLYAVEDVGCKFEMSSWSLSRLLYRVIQKEWEK